MQQIIIYTASDGSFRYVLPTGDLPIEVVLTRDVPPDAINPQIVFTTALPEDYTFRNAWKQNGSAVDHDMDKAKVLFKDMIRKARQPVLASLDVDYQRADESGDAKLKKLVADKKQSLRDAPNDPKIDQCNSITDLKAAWPTALLGPLGS